MIDEGPIESAAIQRVLGRNNTEFGGGEILEGAAEGAETGTNGGKEDDVAHAGIWRRAAVTAHPPSLIPHSGQCFH